MNVIPKSVGNRHTTVKGQSFDEYDTLVISRDSVLFKQLGSFLKEFEPERSPLLIDNNASFAPLSKALTRCDVMLCDLRPNYAAVQDGKTAIKCIPDNTLAIGIIDNNECAPELLNNSQNIRFGGIIDYRNGWYAIWHQIATIRQAWHNPLMVSHIEDVPVSDVIQMITSGRWNTIVSIEDTDSQSRSSDADIPHRGSISFYQGKPFTAWSWQNAGVDAIYDILSVRNGILKVTKNLCAPSIRNVFQQSDQILLSYAFTVDELRRTTLIQKSDNGHFMPFAPDGFLNEENSETSLIESGSVKKCSNNSAADIPPENESCGNATQVTYTLPNFKLNASWWNDYGERLIGTIHATQPQSLPLRWMSDEELSRITLRQDEAGFIFLYGNKQMLSNLFSACSCGFARNKTPNDNRFPVLRIGSSQEKYLYITGLDPAVDAKYAQHNHVLIFCSSNELHDIERINSYSYRSLLLITERDAISLQNEYPNLFEDNRFRMLAAPDFSWQSLKTMLSIVISTIMEIEDETAAAER